MSCIQCANKNKETTGNQFPCLCDQFVHPVPVNIGAGLDKLPRQIASFPEFRRAMFKSIHEQEIEIIDSNNVLVKRKPLLAWRARDKDDLGIMILEMWAYICDSLSFYDEVLANETYLRTAVLRPHLRKLIAMLGYIPRPAVGSLVELAAIADGRLQLNLPVGTAFRSGAFNGNPPQVFEIDNETNIHPLTNQFSIQTPHNGMITIDHPKSLLVSPKGEIKEEALLLLLNNSTINQSSCIKVSSIEKYKGIDDKQYTKLHLSSQTKLKTGALLANLQVLKPNLNTGLWTLNDKTNTINSSEIILEGLSNQIKPGEFIMLVYNNDRRWFKVTEVSQVLRASIANTTMTINGNQFNMPGVQTAVTKLTLDVSVNSDLRKFPGAANWTSAYVNGITVHFGMQSIATVIDEPNANVWANDPLYINSKIERPIEDYEAFRFLLEDKNTMGVSVGGSIRL